MGSLDEVFASWAAGKPATRKLRLLDEGYNLLPEDAPDEAATYTLTDWAVHRTATYNNGPHEVVFFFDPSLAVAFLPVDKDNVSLQEHWDVTPLARQSPRIDVFAGREPCGILKRKAKSKWLKNCPELSERGSGLAAYVDTWACYVAEILYTDGWGLGTASPDAWRGLLTELCIRLEDGQPLLEALGSVHPSHVMPDPPAKARRMVEEKLKRLMVEATTALLSRVQIGIQAKKHLAFYAIANNLEWLLHRLKAK